MAEPGNAPVNIGETRDLVALRAFRVQIPIPAYLLRAASASTVAYLFSYSFPIISFRNTVAYEPEGSENLSFIWSLAIL